MTLLAIFQILAYFSTLYLFLALLFWYFNFSLKVPYRMARWVQGGSFAGPIESGFCTSVSFKEFLLAGFSNKNERK